MTACQRIMKSSVSVAMCMLIYHLRTMLPVGNGIPFYSALAALWRLQPYHDTTKKNAGQRSIGMLTGALFGLLFLIFLKAADLTEPMIVYLLASLERRRRTNEEINTFESRFKVTIKGCCFGNGSFIMFVI